MLALEKKGFSPYAPGCNRGHFTDLAKSQNSYRRFKNCSNIKYKLCFSVHGLPTKDETVKTTGNS